LSDTELHSVSAQSRTVNPAWNDYDELSILMSLADGSMATLNHSLNANRSWWDQLIIGTEGSLYADAREIVLDDETIAVTETPTWGMLDEYEEFVAAVAEQREPEASGSDVRRTMVALEAVKRSLETGGPVDASEL
jgi:predicted dehydrogenase